MQEILNVIMVIVNSMLNGVTEQVCHSIEKTGNELVGRNSNVNWFREISYIALTLSSKESLVYLSSIASRSLFMAI